METNIYPRIAVTHIGIFHADDVIAGAILYGINNEISFYRSLDPEVWELADVLFDVGREYDPSKHHYDHHQTGRAGCRDNGIYYSSAGLVWKHFGMMYLRRVFPDFARDLEQRESLFERLHTQVDETVFWGIDAVDNGQLQSTNMVGETSVHVHDFSHLMDFLNPVPTIETAEEGLLDYFYNEAVKMAAIFLRRIVVREIAILNAEFAIPKLDNGEPLLVLDDLYPWKRFVVTNLPHVRLVVSPGVDNEWKVQTVPVKLGEYPSRMYLPSTWGGLKGAAFQSESGVPDAIGCNPGLFSASAASRKGALKLAEIAMAAA